MDNRIISYSEGLCETGRGFSTPDATVIGRKIGAKCRSISLGCDGFSCLPLVYALCCGASQAGCEVLLCENSDLPSLRYSGRITGTDCTVFVSVRDMPRLHFFSSSGYPLSCEAMGRLLSGEANTAGKFGAIRQVTSFRSLYISSIAEALGGTGTAIPASVSCTDRSVRSLWLEFFTGRDTSLLFQVSPEGRSVCAFMAGYGYIPPETLTIACAYQTAAQGSTVWLPEELHYGADSIPGDIRRFSGNSVPPEAASQRFLTDPLFMCVSLASDMGRFRRTLFRLPEMATVRRELPFSGKFPAKAEFSGKNGRIIARSSGLGRLSVIAQAASAETASELCMDWCSRLKDKNSSG